jgi:CheY-like chemotaxis protein
MVLVVDDEEAVRSAVAGLLDDYADIIQQCGSVNSAVHCLAEHDYDVVICDHCCPGKLSR